MQIKECEDSEKVDIYECRLVRMLYMFNANDEQIEELRYLYNLRNSVLFAGELPEEEILINGCGYLKKLMKSLKEKTAEDSQSKTI